MNTNMPKFPSGEELVEREAESLRRHGFEFPVGYQVTEEDLTEQRYTTFGRALIDTTIEN